MVNAGFTKVGYKVRPVGDGTVLHAPGPRRRSDARAWDGAGMLEQHGLIGHP